MSPIFRIPKIAALSFALALMPEAQTGSLARGQPGQSSSQHSMGTRPTVNGIPNFGRVSEDLYRGGLPSTAGLEALKHLGIDVVVDLRHGPGDAEKNTVTRLGMQYVSIPSWCPFPSDEPFARFLKVMEENRGKKVFVHCRLGQDRTGMAVAAYRMAEEGWTAGEAQKEMKAFGFSMSHHALCPGLAGYEESFPERLKKSPAFRDLSKGETGVK